MEISKAASFENMVSIQKTDAGIKSAVKRALDDIGWLGNNVGRESRILLKPNINGTECITNIQVVAAIVQVLREQGFTNVAIAESSFGDQKVTDFCFKKNGYVDFAAEHGIELINLNASEIVELPVKKPRVKTTLKIAKEIMEADVLINIPVMKVHYATGITLCMKNLKGILVGAEKRTFHDVGLNEAILDLNSMIKPTLNLVDCTTCMEKMGPKGGDLLEMNLIIAGRNSGYTDYVGMQVMGYELSEVPYLEMLFGETSLDPQNIELMGAEINAVKHDFQKVDLQEFISKDLDIENSDACSACENALLLSVMCAGEIDYADKRFYLGSKFEVKHHDKEAIAFGKCCLKAMEGANYRIPGCPPFPFELKKQLEKSKIKSV